MTSGPLHSRDVSYHHGQLPPCHKPTVPGQFGHTRCYSHRLEGSGHHPGTLYRCERGVRPSPQNPREPANARVCRHEKSIGVVTQKSGGCSELVVIEFAAGQGCIAREYGWLASVSVRGLLVETNNHRAEVRVDEIRTLEGTKGEVLLCIIQAKHSKAFALQLSFQAALANHVHLLLHFVQPQVRRRAIRSAGAVEPITQPLRLHQ